MDDIIEKAAADLENSIAEDEQQEEVTQDLGQQIVKAIKDTTANFLGKAQTSDLKAEKDKRGSLTDSKEDPAKSPKKTGKEYYDSSKYEARKGEDMDDDDDDDDDDDKMAMLKKKKAKAKMMKMKKMKKSYDDEDDSDSDEEMYDATEMVEALGESVSDIEKSLDRMEEGMAVFGELLGEMSDPKRDKLLANIAKGIGYLVDTTKELSKSVKTQNDLMKSISQMPGAPRVAGLHFMNQQDDLNKADMDGGGEHKQLSKSDQDRLFKAATARQISMEEYRYARQTGDISILEKAK